MLILIDELSIQVQFSWNIQLLSPAAGVGRFVSSLTMAHLPIFSTLQENKVLALEELQALSTNIYSLVILFC